MDFVPINLTLFIVFVCSLIGLTRIVLRSSSKSKKKLLADPPEAGGAWPLIGHLHLLRKPQPLHQVLGNMADKHGSMFTIKTGVHRALVVSDWEMARECFTTNDRAFSNRPNILMMEILGHNRAMFGFNQGHYWRQMRKLVVLELLSNQRVELLKDEREAEVRTSVKELYKLWENNKDAGRVMVDMQTWFADITINLILRIIFRKSVGYMTNKEERKSRGLRQDLRDFFDLAGVFTVGDALPYLRWFDIGGHEKAMKRTAKRLDVTVEGWLKEHKQKRRQSCKGTKTGDFMDILLDTVDKDAEIDLGRDSDTINKFTCLALTVAASDTTAVTLTWALSFLVNKPEVLRKVQIELEKCIGKDRQVVQSDTKNLVYLKAVIKETMRVHAPVPLSLPHEASEDVTIGDYYIPKGTRLFTNIWKIHRDPRVWSNADEFQPERFLGDDHIKDVDVRGRNFEFIPFGSGRRVCPGVSFAMEAMELTLATLLHAFDFATPSDHEPIDMEEGIGLTNFRATPLEVVINPRLPSHLYR